MNKQEVSKKYSIPIDVLSEYEKWNLCDSVKLVMGDWQYDDEDLDRLSMIMTLHDIGFDNDTIKEYMKTLVKEDKKANALLLTIIQKQRNLKLKKIHLLEKQIEKLDYLRNKIK
ncbi:MerR family transcriptional regulator [Companilactobacillus baiquanensis]|uniref:MerR family transcriptional regulator n=1 Tax=Companilactobacillus baiquanensis TaxID=2486005 RepID=A0ABW1UVW1_9LACO|nr:MerR family transcriptional regulator [Companilactobacillus baiquanensis]